MASFNGNIPTPENWFNLLVEYNYTQSVETNKSTITSIVGYVKRNNANAYPYNYEKTATITIERQNEEDKWVNVTTLSDSSGYNLGSDGYKTFVSNSDDISIPHKNNGKQKIRITFSVDGKLSEYYPIGSVSQIVSLKDIPRASTVSCTSPFIGDTASIYITQLLDTAYYDVTYEIGTGDNKLTGTLATKTTDRNLNFDTSSLKEQIYALIPNNTEIACKIYCKTFTKGTTLGMTTYKQIGDTQYANFNLYAKESDCKATITSSVVETNEKITSLFEANNVFVKGVSLPKITINATPNLSSTIKSYEYDLNNGATYSSTTENEHTFTQALTSNIITTKVIDSRNYTAQFDIDVSQTPYSYIDYLTLSLNKIVLERTEDVSNEVILNCDGVWYNGDFTSTIANALTAKFQYKKSSETEWSSEQEITPTIDGNTFKFTNYSLGSVYDFDSEYQFKVIISDKLMSIEDTETVSKGQEVVAIGDDKGWLYGAWKLNGKTLGAIQNEYNTSTTDGYSSNYLNGKLIVDSGNNTNGTWVKYDNGIMICTKRKQFTNVVINTAWGNFYETASKVDFGNYAQEFIETPTVNITLSVGSTCFCETFTDRNEKSIGQTWLCKPLVENGGTMTFDVTAIGKWK